MIGGQYFFNLCRSHDQYGHHAYIWINPVKVFFLEPDGKNGDPWMTFSFLQKCQSCWQEKNNNKKL